MIPVVLMQGLNIVRVGAALATGDPQATPVTSAESAWQRFESAERGYAADFPGVPETQTTEESVITVLHQASAAFTVVAIPLVPGTDPVEAYDDMEYTLGEKFGGVPIASRGLFRDDLIGRELRMQKLPGNQDLVLWLFVNDNVLYRIGANGNSPFDETISTRFLSSFAFDGSESAAPGL